MKYLKDTPTYICENGDTNFISYMDTDSIYVHAEPLLKHLYPDFDSFDDNKKDEVLEEVALKYQDIITTYYDDLAINCFNIPNTIGGEEHSHSLEMKTECVIRSAYFRNTRRYAQWITKQEGISKENLDIKGLEFMKANFPPIFGKFFHSIVEQVLKGEDKHEITQQIKEFKDKVLDELTLNELGNPTSVKTMQNYQGAKRSKTDIFTPILKRAPAPVRGAIRYNDLLKLFKLDKKYNQITMADKVKWVYLKDNPYKIDTLSFFSYELPPQIEDYILKYINKSKTFDTILLKKLENFYDDVGWELSLNPYLNKVKYFEV